MKATTNTLAKTHNVAETVNLIIITNPLQPAESRQIYHREWNDGFLQDYTGELSGQWVIQSSHRGTVDQTLVGEMKPHPGEYIVLVPLLGGGDGGGKDILRLVAMVALVVVSGGIASGAGIGGFGATASGAMTAGSIASAVAIQVGGTLLINKLLPVATPEDDSGSSNQSYGIDGPKNVSTEGIVFPLVYGEHWVGGNIISMFVDNVGTSQQYLNMLIALSEGEIESISEITINDQPLSSYSDVIISPRYGLDNQEVIPYFNDIVVPVNRGLKVPRHMLANWNDSEAQRQANLKTLDASYYLGHTTTGDANRIRVDCVFPIGLGVKHNNGKFDQGSSPEDGCNFVVGYRESGTTDDFKPLGAWGGSNLMSGSTSSGGLLFDGTFHPDTQTYGESSYLDELNSEGYAAKTGILPTGLGVLARGNSQSTIRRSYYSGELDPSKRYELRIYNSQNDDVAETRRHNILFIADINQIQYDDIRYNHTAMLGLRIKMNDQLNSIPTVLSRVKGIKCQVFDEITQSFVREWTNNPAWIVYDCLTHARYGASVPASKIKLSYFRQWAQYCVDQSLTFNGAITESSNIWDAIKPILRVGRSRLVRSGTKYQVATEKLKPSQMLFSMGNIRQGSLSVSWSSMEGRANEVHVKYYDKNDTNKPKTVIVQDNVARLRGDDVRKSDIDLRGVDNVDQASREGAIALNLNKLTQSVSFDAPVESIAITLGDVFSVQHDMSQWGSGGLLAAGSTVSVINLDKPVAMEVGRSYQVLVKHDFITEHTNTISQILGNTVYFSEAFNPDSYVRITRLIGGAAGVDYGVLEFAWSGTKYGVILDKTVGLQVGHEIELRDTDVLEFAGVVLSVGESDSITLSAPLRKAPLKYSGYAFGIAGSVVKQFTCLSISGTGDMWRTISGLEYREDALSDVPIDVVVPEYLSYPMIVNVDFEGWSQTGSSAGNPNRVEVSFHWSSVSSIYDRAEVFVINKDEIRSIGTYTDKAVIEANEGDAIAVAIVPIDRYGRKPDFSLVNKHSYSVSNQFAIDSPLNLTVASELALTSTGQYQNNILLDFDAPADTFHVVSYECQYKLARRDDWMTLGNSLETHYEMNTVEIGIVQFRVRTVYLAGIHHSDWAFAQITILGTYDSMATIGLSDPVDPKLYISVDYRKARADIRVSVQRLADADIQPESFVLFYSADDIPNVIQLGSDDGNKLRFKSVEIPQEFSLDVTTGSTLTEIRYADPQDIVDVDLSGLWWVKVVSAVNGSTRFHKVAGASTSELQLPKGEQLSFLPQAGDTVIVAESGWHDSRLPEFKLAWVDDEVIVHGGVQFDTDYYVEVVQRAAEGTVQGNQSDKMLHYYPAFGPDTTAVFISMADFTLTDDVWNYNGTLDLKIPANMNWASVTCCFVRAGTAQDGATYVRSNILPLSIAGPA